MTSRVLSSLSILVITVSTCQAAITDFDQWTLVEDPGHPGFNASATAVSATLSAGDQSIPGGTDIGFQSVDGLTVGGSSTGFFFDASSDFSLAISYQLSFSGSPNGLLGLGFGIGEDGDGRNSAGVAMVTSSGSPFLTFAGAARVNDVNEAPLPLAGVPASLTGTLFIDFQSASGDVVIGASNTFDAAAADETATFSGIQQRWNGDPLMASFFLRSESQPGFSAWQGGQADAVFSNFRVLSGSVTAIPEPSMPFAIALTATGLLTRRKRSHRRGCRGSLH